MATRGNKGSVGSEQPSLRKLCFYVDGTGTAALVQGKQEGVLTDNNTGDYTITFAKPGRRLVSVSAPALLTAGLRHQLHADTDATRVRVLLFGYNNTSATDGDFFIEVTVSDSAYDF